MVCAINYMIHLNFKNNYKINIGKIIYLSTFIV